MELDNEKKSVDDLGFANSSEMTSKNSAFGRELVKLEQTNNISEDLQETIVEKESEEEINAVLNDWNWGAFSMPIFWGVNNNLPWITYVNAALYLVIFICIFIADDTLRLLIVFFSTLFGILIRLYILCEGNRLSWNKRSEDMDIKTFANYQKYWNLRGSIFIFSIIFYFLFDLFA